MQATNQQERGGPVGDQPTPYRDAAPTYRAAGWVGVLPIPYRTKRLVARGWTGHGGAWPSSADIQAWCDSDRPDEGGGNIALRLPPDVVGIDVDAYGDKAGADTLAQAVARWGPLPDTWMSTARDDGKSGIRLFRIPEGLRWPGQVGPGIETIHAGHRYSMVWPSAHPEGRIYRWYRPDGLASTAPPRVDELPDLPDTWVIGLTGGETAEQVSIADLSSSEVNGWLLQRSEGDMCRAMRTVLDRLLEELRVGSAHESLRRLVGLVRLAEQGHAGLANAIGRAHAAFMATVTSASKGSSQRDEASAQAEWSRSLGGAVRRVLGNASVADTEPVDPCSQPFAGLVAAVTIETAVPLATVLPTVGSSALAGVPDPVAEPEPEPRSEAQQETDDLLALAGATSTPGADQPAAPPAPAGPAAARERTTWAPRDLSAVLAGEQTEPEPCILARDDGRALFYAGKVNGLLGESESGKAQPYSAPIATPDGWTTMGELVVGSVILGSDGLPQTVTAIHERGEREVWEVVTGQGVVVEACAEHLWAVSDANDRTRGRGHRVLTTEELYATQRLGSGAPRWQLPMPAAAQFVDPGPMPVDPYLLGLLIGDGGLTKGITFTNPEAELQDQFAARVPWGCRVRETAGQRCWTVSVSSAAGDGRNPLLIALRDLGMYGCRSTEKAIPRIYQQAPVGVRLALLQGLMDTDGGIEGRSAIYSTSSPQLAEDVAELVRGLGGTATPHWRVPKFQGGEGAPACRLTVILPSEMAPFRLARKARRYEAHATRREPVNRIDEVAPTGRMERMRCISVSNPDHLYRTTGHTLTHNTWLLLAAVVQQLELGHAVLYLDFEDTADSVVARLLALGVDPELLGPDAGLFHYIAPDESLHTLAAEDLADVLARADYVLIGLDGVNAAMTLLGLDLGSNTDATRFSQVLLKPLARTGAAVVTVDHVGKDKENRGKGGIGAQAKRAMVTGCALAVDVLAPFGRGQTGKLKLTVDKDRPGHVRGFAENSKNAGIAVLESGSNGSVRVRIDVPGGTLSAPSGPFRPTAMMEKISRLLSTTDGDLSGKAIEDGVEGRAVTIRAALDRLVEEGYVSRHSGPRNAVLHRYEKTYREMGELVGADMGDGPDDY